MAADPAESSRLDQAGFRLTVPAGWSAEPANSIEGQLQTRRLPLELAAQPAMHRAAAPNVTAESRSALADGSMLVTWLAAFCAGPPATPPVGQPLLVGGREASSSAGSTVCAPLEPTEDEPTSWRSRPQRLDVIVVCQRDAPESVVAQLRSVLERVDWRTP